MGGVANSLLCKELAKSLFLVFGFAVLAGIDNWKEALVTYRRNFPDTKTINADIEKITPQEIAVKNVDVIIGGPPCQGFSVSGKRLMNDPRNKLYKAFVSNKQLNPCPLCGNTIGVGIITAENCNGKVYRGICWGDKCKHKLPTDWHEKRKDAVAAWNNINANEIIAKDCGDETVPSEFLQKSVDEIIGIIDGHNEFNKVALENQQPRPEGRGIKPLHTNKKDRKRVVVRDVL